MTFNINCIPLLIIWCATLATIPSIHCKEIDSTPSSALYGTGKIFMATGSNHQTRLIINQHSNNCPFNYIGVITRKANSFPEFLTQSFLAVDKSLLIREILRNKGEPVLITCPRKWGKTTNMLMLESFLKITVDEDGNVIPRENTIEFRLFRDGVLPNNRSLNHPLLIYEKEKEWFMENMGVTPVIYVTFDGVRGNNLQEIVNAVRVSMSPTFRKHAYLKWFLNRKIEKESPSGQNSLQTDYKDFEDIESYNHTTTTEQIERSLHLLTRLLNEFYQKKVFLILDDYDALISEIYINPDFSKSDVEKTLKFYNNLMQTSLKNRDIIEGCVLTGIFHLTENEFLSPTLNNLQTTSFLNNPLFFYYGINQFELKGLYEMLRIDGQTKTTHYWYNGYHAGLHSQLRIANPWSVACYLQNGTYRSYWEGGARRVEHLLEGYFNNANFLNQFHKLIRNESIQANDKSYDLRFSKQDFVDMMKNIRFEECTKREYHIDNAMKFFLATGYVALADTREYDHQRQLLLRVPNIEVRLAMKMELERFIMKLDETKYSPAVQEAVSNFRNFFLENDNTTIENFQTALTGYFASIPPMIKMEELAKTELSTPWKQYILGNENWINSIIHNIGFLADFQLQTIEGELMVDQENSKLDAIFANDTRGMIVEFKFHKQGDIDQQLHERLNEIKKSSYAYFFKKYFQPFRALNDVKIASVLICPNGTTRVWAETANPWIWSEKQVVGDEEKTVYSIYNTYDHELNDTEAKKPIFEDDLKKLDVPKPQIVSDILLHSMKNLESSSLVKCKQFFVDAKTYNAINETDFVKGILSFANSWRDNIKWFPNMWKNLSDINSFMLEAKCYKKHEFDNELKNLLQDAYSQPEFFNNFKKHDNILFHFYLNKIISQQQMKNVMDLLTKEKSEEKARKKYYDIINKFVKELWRNKMNLKHKTTKAKKE